MAIVRKAKLKDAKSIQDIVNVYAKDQIMLGLSIPKIYETIRDFTVIEDGGEVVAVGALKIVWGDIAEIRSIATKKEAQKKGYGTQIINEILKEARSLELQKVFLLTYQENFFASFGFIKVEKSDLPHKVWSDCVNCTKFPDCDEIAMIKDISQD